jgi:ATP-dependent HslUV protease subunit HslV
VADADDAVLRLEHVTIAGERVGMFGIGSGGNYALSAARALIDIPSLTAEDIVRRSMKIAGDICVYTNHSLVVETI